MRQMRNKAVWVLSMLLLLALAGVPAALGQGAAPSKDDLSKQIQVLMKEMQPYKKDGKIGERWDGYTEAVKKEYAAEDPKLAKLIKDMNGARKALYTIIAKEQGVTVQAVGERAGLGYFKLAKTGEYLKTSDNQWRQKK